MPNHVSHKITFDATHAAAVFAACCPDGQFDFETLVPRPLHMYHGNLSGEDERDFKCNWLSWQRENWGTKWNAYQSSCIVDGDKAVIKFDTAWSVPYPVLAAFANKFGVSFEHCYFDEGSNFWGIEEWGVEDGIITRTKKRGSLEADYQSLCIELKGYDPLPLEDD